uniref:Uncharacterized protein n=1 Tax=Chaetoceros debilis TaxID=122233 RepID=A0A7S3QIR8_9STRA|mmetsp:Transcript_26365/g.40296  ORF Transcript_26365/g.40296 Transcript_26365/m.40296 type:complete len:104 (+) Transcript_26365:132-443(+)
MGNCCAQEKGSEMQRRRSSFNDLNDSRHVMMRRSSRNGPVEQRDVSFYKPRDESMFADLKELKDLDISDEESRAGVGPGTNQIEARAEKTEKKAEPSESIHSA